MKDPRLFYNAQLAHYTTVEKELKQQLITYSMYRLSVFIITAVGVYFSFSYWQVALGIAIAGTAVFLLLLSKYVDIKSNKDLAKALIEINKIELKIADDDYHWRDGGVEYQEADHHYSLDLDLFGRGSFFQYIYRTVIQEGQDKLANAIKANNISGINERQEAIKELASKVAWSQNYSAVGSLIKVETSAQHIINWLAGYKPFLPSIFKWLPMAFIGASLLVLVLTVFETIPIIYIGYWLLVGLGITGLYLKQTNKLAFHTSKAKETFKQYAELLKLIEQEDFTSELLQEKQQKIRTADKSASEIFKDFSKALDALDNRNNLLSAVLGNGYFLWDIMQVHKIEKWISNYGSKVNDWFEVVTFFDAYNSLGTFSYNHQEYVYPTITTSGPTIEAKALGHPLLISEKRVTSDLKIDSDAFFIITGANMAGKSTFLRTVSLHIVMANMGLPVCAETSNYVPIKLITSMRTSDSLTDESSYFFSELTRLKFIVGAIKEDQYFIVLDEILKGTNSTDKAIGSKKFVEQLVATKATGIIATHDLSLCKIEQHLEPVKNYYFDAEIVNDELYFDYKLKEGVCKNMNASFLLKKMKIVE